MKKLLFLLLLIAVGYSAQAQDELITYKIDTTGYSEGLIIPSPFYITVTEFSLVKAGEDFNYISYTKTFTDTLNVRNLRNDSLSSAKRYSVTLSNLQSFTPIVIFNNTVKQNLKDIYGASNVSILQ